MQKKRYLDTIAQLCRAISSQLTHIPNTDNRKKKLVKQQYLLHMSPHYGELQPTRGGDSFVSLGTPANFNGFRVLAALLHGTPVLGVSQTAALNRGRHLYSTGRPSRWALAHISSYCLHWFYVVRCIAFAFRPNRSDFCRKKINWDSFSLSRLAR